MASGSGIILEEQTSKKQGRTLRPLANLYPYLWRYKGRVFAAIFFLFLAAATTLTLPIAVRRMIDHGFNAQDPALINDYFSVLVVIAGVLATASACRYYFVIWLGERVVADVRRDVFSHITGLSANFFDTAQTGEIISRLTADTTQVKSAMGATASMALRNTLLGIGALIMMIYTSPRLSAIVIGAIPLIVFPIIAYGRAVRKRTRTAQDKLAEATAYASEAIGAVRTMQAFSNGGFVRKQFANAVEFSFDTARLAVRTRALLTAMAIFMIFSSVVAVLWFGSHDVLSGNMTEGTLSQFLLYAVFAAGALAALSEVWGELSQAAGAAERLGELFDEKPAVQAPTNPKKLPKPIQGKIELSGIDFAYPTRPEIQVLKDFTAVIKPGETVAVVGASGAGKSTIFSLLLRFYDPETGAIKIDGMDLKTLSPEEYRKQVALVPQDSMIFAASAYDNILYGKPDATREDIIAAAKAANAHEFIAKLSDGYDTQLGERGVMLSGGQKQRIAIARAILKNAPILLLDEATSALDAESEKAVQDALDKLMVGRTTLIIAHRLATILKANRILVMSEGQVVEQGTHQELVAKNGVYANLARLQFGEEAASMKNRKQPAKRRPKQAAPAK